MTAKNGNVTVLFFCKDSRRFTQLFFKVCRIWHFFEILFLFLLFPTRTFTSINLLGTRKNPAKLNFLGPPLETISNYSCSDRFWRCNSKPVGPKIVCPSVKHKKILSEQESLYKFLDNRPACGENLLSVLYLWLMVGARRLRPLAQRRLKTARPFFVAIRV